MEAPRGFISACGPTALAALTGLTQTIAGNRLYRIMKERSPHTRVRKGTPLSAMTAALKECGRTTEKVKPLAAGKGTMTFAAWLRQRHEGLYLVIAANHYVVVSDGRVIEDNGVPVRRGRVTSVLKVGLAAHDGPSVTPSADVNFWFLRGEYDQKLGRPPLSEEAIAAYAQGRATQ